MKKRRRKKREWDKNKEEWGMIKQGRGKKVRWGEKMEWGKNKGKGGKKNEKGGKEERKIWEWGNDKKGKKMGW